MPSKKSWRRSSIAKGASIRSLSGPALSGKIGRMIESAFRGEGAKWRTIGGIARETGLLEKDVRAYVRANEQLFERARLFAGRQEALLYPGPVGGVDDAVAEGCGGIRTPPGMPAAR